PASAPTGGGTNPSSRNHHQQTTRPLSRIVSKVKSVGAQIVPCSLTAADPTPRVIIKNPVAVRTNLGQVGCPRWLAWPGSSTWAAERGSAKPRGLRLRRSTICRRGDWDGVRYWRLLKTSPASRPLGKGELATHGSHASGRHVVTILCGSNVDMDTYRRWADPDLLATYRREPVVSRRRPDPTLDAARARPRATRRCRWGWNRQKRPALRTKRPRPQADRCPPATLLSL
ncbi:MAG: hypothetical protein QOE12_3172, partial [Mycobacterium sp.]|nr:hypothetical protein [Mycobacterium sp.]